MVKESKMNEAKLKLGQKLFKEIEITKAALEQALALKDESVSNYNLSVSEYKDGSGIRVTLDGLQGFNEVFKDTLVSSLEEYLAEIEKEFEEL